MTAAGEISQGLWQKVFRKNQDVVSRNVSGEMFLIPVKGRLADMQKIFTLNPVAEFIWQEIDGMKSLGEIRGALVERFDVGEEEAAPDIEEFVSDLLAAELIVE